MFQVAIFIIVVTLKVKQNSITIRHIKVKYRKQRYLVYIYCRNLSFIDVRLEKTAWYLSKILVKYLREFYSSLSYTNSNSIPKLVVKSNIAMRFGIAPMFNCLLAQIILRLHKIVIMSNAANILFLNVKKLKRVLCL